MKSNWKMYKLNDVCLRIYSGGTPSTRESDYWNGDLPWLSSGETGQKYINKTERTITQKGVDNSSTKLAYKNSIVMASAGQGYTRGQVSFLNIDTYVNQSIIVLEPNELLINPLFLYFNLDTRYQELRQISDGTSTRGSLSCKIIKELSIELPPLDVQEKIVSRIFSIDKKIELNNNHILNIKEQMSGIVKKHIFDFKDYLPEDIVEIDDVSIPYDWKYLYLKDFVIINKRGCSPKYSDSGIPVINQRCIRNGVIIEEAIQYHDPKVKIEDSSFYQPYDVLINSMGTGTLGRISQIGKLDKEMLIHSCVTVLRPNTEIISKYLFGEIIKMKAREIEKLGVGSTNQTSLSNKELGKLRFVIPPLRIQKKYNQMFKDYLDLISQMLIENTTLTEMRLILLPRMINGDIEI